MQKQKRSKINRLSIAVFLCSLVVALMLGISARFLITYRIYKAFSLSAAQIYTLWSEIFEKYTFPSINAPPVLAMDAQVYSKSEFSDVKFNMSYNPMDVKIAAALYASCADGSSKKLYAFADKSSAGFSFGEQSDSFYTIPSKTLKQGIGMLGSLVSHSNCSIDAKKIKTICTILSTQKQNMSFKNDDIVKSLVSIACIAEFNVLGKDKYGIKIKTSALRTLADIIAPQSHQIFLSDCDPNSFFTFIIHLRDEKLQLVECTTAPMSGGGYDIGIDFANDFKDFDVRVSNLASHRDILTIQTSVNDKQIFFDLDFNCGEFDMRAMYDFSLFEIYSRISAGKYLNIIARGGKEKDSYVFTAVSTESSKDNVLILKFLKDSFPESEYFDNITTKNVTFEELLKLQKELNFICNLYTKE